MSSRKAGIIFAVDKMAPAGYFSLKVLEVVITISLKAVIMVDSKYLEGWRRRFAAQQAENQALALAARAALPKALEILKKHGAKRVILFGSLCRSERFHSRSDIDLAVSGIPAEKFIRAGADLMMALDWPVDLKPFEELNEFFRGMILQKGEVLYAE